MLPNVLVYVKICSLVTTEGKTERDFVLQTSKSGRLEFYHDDGQTIPTVRPKLPDLEIPCA